jgi:hypothetical protein
MVSYKINLVAYTLVMNHGHLCVCVCVCVCACVVVFYCMLIFIIIIDSKFLVASNVRGF